MSDGESVRHSSYTSSPSSDLTSGETSQQSEPSCEEQNVSFNLSDPTDMEVKLDQLTDKEMDELLKQAYKVNKELKTELLRQERQQSGRSQQDKSRSKTTHSASTKGASSRSPKSNTSLPPLRKPHENKTHGPRGFTSLHHRSSAQHHQPSPISPSRQKAKTAVQQPSSKPRPEWDDRYNF